MIAFFIIVFFYFPYSFNGFLVIPPYSFVLRIFRISASTLKSFLRYTHKKARYFLVYSSLRGVWRNPFDRITKSPRFEREHFSYYSCLTI